MISHPPSCDNAVTAAFTDATATLSEVDFWGYDGAGNPQYRAVVHVVFNSGANDWRVSIQLPTSADQVVHYGPNYAVYNGASFDCGTSGSFTVSPAGAWSQVITPGGSVDFEYVATNPSNIADVVGNTVVSVLRTASS